MLLPALQQPVTRPLLRYELFQANCSAEQTILKLIPWLETTYVDSSALEVPSQSCLGL